jgi:hypothetical protein
MAGLLACAWSMEDASSAPAVFEEVRRTQESLTNTVSLRHAVGRGFALARFSRPGANADTHAANWAQNAEEILTGAGWWIVDGDPALELTDALERRQPATGLAARLDGQHALCHVDLADGRVTGWCDATALRPVYICALGGLAWLSTDPLALAKVFRCGLDPVAVQALFAGDTVRPPHSGFQGICKLDLGERAILEAGRLRIERWWDPLLVPLTRGSLADTVERGLAAMERSGRRLRRIYPAIQADLTGGFDSRLMVAVLNLSDLAPVQHNVVGPEDNADVRIARLISKEMDWPLTVRQLPADWGRQRVEGQAAAALAGCGEIRLDLLDSPLAIRRAELGCWDGWATGAAGEQFRDFFWVQEFTPGAPASRLDLDRLLRLRFIGTANANQPLLPDGWLRAYQATVRGRMETWRDRAADLPKTRLLDALYLWKVAGFHGRYSGSFQPLTAALVPLGTRELTELALASSPTWRKAGRLQQELITAANLPLARLPVAIGGTALPASWRHPGQYTAYYSMLARRVVRKGSQLLLGRQMLRHATEQVAGTGWGSQTVGEWKRRGWKLGGEMLTAPLYNPLALAELGTALDMGNPDRLPEALAVWTLEHIAQATSVTSLAVQDLT